MPVTESRLDSGLGTRGSGFAARDAGLGARDSGLGVRDSGLEGGKDLGSRLTVDCIDDPAVFAAMRGEWNDLLRASAADNPFLTWEWLHTWWLHLGEPSTLRLIVVRAGAELVAIAPLRLVNSALYWFSRLEFLGTGHAGSDYLDLIVRRGHETASIDAIAQYLKTSQVAMRFNHLQPSSLGARLAQQMASDGWTSSSVDDGSCPIVPLTGLTFDGYLATLGSSHRANFRRRLKGLGQKFAMQFEQVSTHRDRCDMLAALVGFHEKRWKEEGGSSAFMTPNVVAFQDEITRQALEAGWLRMYVLRLDGEAAAVMYGFHYGGRFYFYQHGFDDRYLAHSVGLVLMGLTIRAAIDEGAGEFDMLWGVEPYKFLWARDARILQRVELFPIHFGGTVHRHALEARRNVKNLARRVLAIGESLGS